MTHVRLLRLYIALLFIVAISGCKSFDESIKPLIEQKAPPGYKPPLYMTGTIPVEQAVQGDLTAEVWRVNSTLYPDSIRLYMRVFDSTGKLVTNLAPPYYKGSDDYKKIWSGLTEQIGDNGKPGKIDQFTVREFSDQDGIPYEISLVLDYSGTMGSNIDGLEEAAVAFIKLKRPQDRIAVVKFDKTPKVVVASTSSESELLGKFTGDGLQGFGTYTALYAAAKMGGEQIAAAPTDRPRALILFTDGVDNASGMAPSQLYEYSRAQNIPIFTVAFGAVDRKVLEDISAYTGGRFYQTYTSDEMRAAFQDIYRSLRNYYLVTYHPPNVIGKHIARLTLDLPKAGRQLSATAIYNTLTGEIYKNDKFEITDTVFFEYNKSALVPGSEPMVRAIAELMRDNQRLKIEVGGHTDAIGTPEYNQKLSEARANAVRDAILALGVEENRVRARGYGMDFPRASNETEEGRQKNRRTEFLILQK